LHADHFKQFLEAKKNHRTCYKGATFVTHGAIIETLLHCSSDLIWFIFWFIVSESWFNSGLFFNIFRIKAGLIKIW